MQGATPAASLIVMRDRLGDAPELLIVRRSSRLAFAAGAYVFPGGRVEAADADLAARLCPHLEPDDGAGRIAAVRETIEETGIVVGLSPRRNDRTVADRRARQDAGRYRVPP